jgi:hypothetical protein
MSDRLCLGVVDNPRRALAVDEARLRDHIGYGVGYNDLEKPGTHLSDSS